MSTGAPVWLFLPFCQQVGFQLAAPLTVLGNDITLGAPRPTLLAGGGGVYVTPKLGSTQYGHAAGSLFARKTNVRVRSAITIICPHDKIGRCRICPLDLYKAFRADRLIATAGVVDEWRVVSVDART